MIALAFATALHTATLAQAAPAPRAQQSAQDIWDKRCVFCHGADGRSRTKKGRKYKAPDFTTEKWQKETADEEIEDAVSNGVPKTKMPSFKAKLTPDEIMSMIPFLRAFGGKK